MKSVLVVGMLLLVLPAALQATPYIPPEEAMKIQTADDQFVLGQGVPAPLDYSYDPLDRYQMCADFITTLQVSDTSSAAYGGMREGEHLSTIIQTDNTSESIWIWSHYYRLTGNDLYHDNIDAAWFYCMNNPAYDEEGGDGPVDGYYRVYNCSWALRAEMEYRDVYSDLTYVAYGESCASYLCHHPLILRYPAGMYRKLNGLVMGWAVGNLYEYGDYVGNPVFMSKALDMADSLKTWAEANGNKLRWDEWAMNGGSVMWGIVNSHFQAYPADMETWVETYAPYLDTEIDSAQYQNAWRAWAALGQVTAAEVLDSETYAGYFKHLADTLVLNDGDNDGGIPVIDAEPDDHDQSWVTNYLGYMCMDRLMVTAGLARQDVQPVGRLSVTVAPMPSRGWPALEFGLAEPSRVWLDLYDVTGRMVCSEDAGVLPAGWHYLELGSRVGQPAASPGLYFYVLHSGRGVANGKIVVLR